MGLVINRNIRKIQRQYINSIIKFFTSKEFPYDYDDALSVALDIYKKMEISLNKLANSMSTTYSRFSSFYKGYPIHGFQSSDRSSDWYFAYIRNENNDIVVFDMKNVNQIKRRIQKIF